MMSECKKIRAEICVPSVGAFTFPEGPRGKGIREILQTKNELIIIFDDGVRQILPFPDWWFGTRSEYNRLSAEEKQNKDLYFIEEGT